MIIYLVTVATALTKCNGPEYTPLGCFTDEYPFSIPLYRPPRMPHSIDQINATFTLSNARVRDHPINWLEPQLNAFERYDRLMVVSHGWWTINGWIKETRDVIEAKKVNFVEVNWKNGANLDDYTQSAANTQIVGRQIAYMYNQLTEVITDELRTLKLNIAQHYRQMGFRGELHCVGHSLGAHLCGYAGSYSQTEFRTLINRITGLDPAGASYGLTETEVRLDQTDAQFVDIMHATAGSRGMAQSCGHADFFINGGVTQPMCDGLSDGACSHDMVTWFFVDSVRNPCQFRACSRELYKLGLCEGCVENCNAVGYHARRPVEDTDYYGSTLALTRPYC